MRKFAIAFFIVILIGYMAMPIRFASSHEAKEQTDCMNITVDGFTPIVEEWEEIGVSPWIDSNDNDTSVIRFNYTLENEIKVHSYWSFDNLTREDIGNVTSILNVTVYAWVRSETDNFRVKFYWFNGSAWVMGGSFATSVTTWHLWLTGGYDISSILDTPQKVEDVRLRLTNWGAPSYDNEGRISYIWLKVWFTYFESVPFSVVDLYTWLGIGLGGIALMVWSPAWVAWKIKKKGIDVDTVERIGFALVIFVMGFGLFISWLYH